MLGQRGPILGARAGAWAFARVLLVFVFAAGSMGWSTEVVPGKPKQQRPQAGVRQKAPPTGPVNAAPVEAPAAEAPVVAPNVTLDLQLPAAAADTKKATPAGQGSSGPLPAPAGKRVPKVAAGAVALAATLEGDATATALVLTLTRTAAFTTFMMVDPHRVVVDLQDVDFRVPPVSGTAGRGLIKSFRYGLLAPGKSRIVIDLTGPAAIEKADIVALRGADTVQLRVALVPSSIEAFRAAAIGNPGPQVPAATSAAAPPVAAEMAKPRKGARPVLVLDPGHGGVDAGTIGSTSVAEKDVVLRFAKLLRDKLRATGRFDVHLTREIDIFVKLDERVRLARSLGCDLFISLHTDSVPAQLAHLNVRGATIYTMGAQDGDARAQKLAEKENLSDVVAGVEALQEEPPEVAGILNDLMRRETSASTQIFTGTLLEYMKKSTGLSREPQRHAAFRVLRAPDMPSVLVELGFLSNREDEKLLVARDWQEQVAAAIGRAVETYFAKRTSRAPY